MPTCTSHTDRVPTVNKTRLDAYIAAEVKILAGQSVRMGDRYLQLPDLADIRAEIARLQRIVAQEESAAVGQVSGIRQANFGGPW